MACVVMGLDGSSEAPNYYAEARNRSDIAIWVEAVRFEVDSLFEMGVLELVRLLQGRRVMKTRWVIDIK